MQRKLSVLFIFITLLLFGIGTGNAQKATPNKNRILPVMTRNMDAGSDFWYVLAAAQDPNSTEFDLLVAITKTYMEMHASNIPQRADGIAREIEATKPYLVGLQEVTVLSTGPYGGAPTTIIDNSLEALLAALRTRGLHYAPIVVQKNAQIVLPAFDITFSYLIDVGLVDYDVVLARSDLPVSQFKLEGTQAKHFDALLDFFLAGRDIQFTRGWISVDAKLRGKLYRFVTTHLETLQNDYQAAQTEELLAGPLNTDLPVILAGDLNSDADSPSWDNGPAYGILAAAGFEDPWKAFYRDDPGFTWPLYVEDSGIGPHNLQRIDLILSRGTAVRPEAIQRTGTAALGGLWSSDHAGVEGSFLLLP